MTKVKTAREGLLSLILTGFVFSFLLLVVQTSTGKIGDFKVYVWLWFLILYLPPILLLFLTKNKSFETNIRGLKILSALFVSATLGVIILEAFIGLEDIQVIKTSTYFLIPLEILLVYLIWYRKADPSPPDPIVFISYNHKDLTTALKIKEALDKAKIEVIMDRKDMTAGKDITMFIKNSIKASNVTVSVVSNASLESAWVGSETIDSLLLQTFDADRKYIACYLNDDFLTQNNYTQKAVAKIDIRIIELDALIQEAHSNGRNTRDSDSKRTRSVNLKNNMDLIIAQLQNSLCLNVNQDTFNDSMERLIESIETDV